MWESLSEQHYVLITIEVVISIIVCVVVYAVVKIHRNHQRYAHLPGPPLDSFFTGNIKPFKEVFKRGGLFPDVLLEFTKTYGKTFRVVFFNFTIVVTSDPESVKELLVTGNHPKDAESYKSISCLFGKRFMGNGLVSNTDSKDWASKRTFMNPCFQKSYLRGLIDDFNLCGDSLMSHLAKFADGKTKIKMLDQFNHVSLDLISKVAFGMEINSIESESNPFTKAVFTSFKGLGEQTKNPFFVWNPANWGMVLESRRAVDYLRKTGSRVIKERREKVGRGDYVPNDILTYLIKMEDEMPEIDHEDILDDFVTIFIAGQETTAILMAFMVMCLTKNPDVMERLQTEITSTVGDKPVLTLDDLNHFPYLDKVIKETLRLYPPATQTFRYIEKECTLDGHRIPGGSSILASTYLSSHMEEYFENPLKFDPENFNANQRVSPYTYYPFAIGPRTCIGRNFGETEAKIVMIKLLQRFNIELDPDQDLGVMSQTTLRPRGNIICTLTLKDG